MTEGKASSLTKIEIDELVKKHQKFVETSGKQGKFLDFSYKKISDYKFIKLDFNDVNLTSCCLDNCHFEDVSFSQAKINFSKIKNSQFINCNFIKSEISKNTFDNASFENCDFTRSFWLFSKFVKTVFEKCDFSGISQKKNSFRDSSAPSSKNAFF